MFLVDGVSKEEAENEKNLLWYQQILMLRKQPFGDYDCVNIKTRF